MCLECPNGEVIIVYKNESTDNVLVEDMCFQMDSLRIDGCDGDTVEVNIKPGQ